MTWKDAYANCSNKDGRLPNLKDVQVLRSCFPLLSNSRAYWIRPPKIKACAPNETLQDSWGKLKCGPIRNSNQDSSKSTSYASRCSNICIMPSQVRFTSYFPVGFQVRMKNLFSHETSEQRSRSSLETSRELRGIFFPESC